MKCLIVTVMILLSIPVGAQTVVFAPQWRPQTQFAGYYAAQAKGYYKSEGLDVEICHPTQSENAYSLLASGKAQFINLNLIHALHYISEGADLVNILQTSQVTSLLLVGHTALPDIAALEDCKLGVYAHVDPRLIQRIFSKYNVKSRLVRYNSGVNVFLSNAVDVCLMASYNEFIQLAECGYKVDSSQVVSLSDWGYDMPEEGVYVSRAFYEQNPEVVRKFVEASKKGWDYVATHEAEALEITMAEVRKNQITTNEYHQHQMLKEVLPLQINPETGTRTYRLSRKSFQSVTDFILPGVVTYNDFVK